MKKLIISGVFCSVLLLGGFQVASAEETTTTAASNTEMLAKIQDLMKLIADLQAKLSAARGEIQELAADLREGAQGDDVKKVQEILASDPSLFSVAPTGYFGPLTKAALIKFQVKFGLAPTGELDAETRAVMKEFRAERKNGMVPAGLATSAAAHDRVKARLQAKWGDCVWGEKFRASDCKKGHDKDKVKDHDDDEDEDDDDNATTTRAEAQDAIEEAKEAIADLEADIAEMEDDDADADDIEDAEEMLHDAEEKLMEAEEAFEDGDYEEAEEAAEEALEILGEDEDDEEDDEDDDDEDDDEDDDDEDDEEDDD